MSQEQKLGTVPPIPAIVISTEGSKSNRVKRRRINDAIKNDNEDYLDGYGQDYGALSSATDLEMEGLVHFQPKEITKSLKGRDKQVSKGRNPKSPKHNKSKSPKVKRKFNIFSRQTKKKAQEGITKSAVTPGYSFKETSPDVKDQSFEVKGHPQRTSTAMSDPDVNSLGVNTSLGSEPSTSSFTGVIEERELGEQLILPTEEESLSAQVFRLQRSVEEYDQRDSFRVEKDKV